MTTELFAQGKVRDIYEAGEDLLMVASDRISAFDVVLPSPIPDKGRVLTALSLFWFDKTADLVPNHLITADFREFPEPFRGDAELAGRAMLVRRADMFPVECVARGYITGSGWKDYGRTGSVCGIPLPAGLVESERLPEPIFTPATKATTGHDENISIEEAAELIGEGLAQRLKELTLGVYERGAEIARELGIIVADTKFEFGLIDGEIALCDEVLTPDSSRFWPADTYQAGGSQPSFDKQYVRDWLDRSGWDHEPPPPELPADVVEATAARYREAYERLSGESWGDYLSRMGAA
ncbi:MAG: phosphoribosylaminoimidazolesuccinocarboxamide synthase [Actinobacteria bacterium]|nr:phosphoribosylaminoimidazolesuccinocarboxamide synthase [Actinomycetota bacterium]